MDITGGMTCSCSENSQFRPLFRASCIIIINTDALLDVWKGANRRQLWVLILFWWHQKFSIGALCVIAIGKTLTHKRATCLSLSQVSMTMSVVSSPSTVSVRSYVSTAITNNELREQHESSQQSAQSACRNYDVRWIFLFQWLVWFNNTDGTKCTDVEGMADGCGYFVIKNLNSQTNTICNSGMLR